MENYKLYDSLNQQRLKTTTAPATPAIIMSGRRRFVRETNLGQCLFIPRTSILLNEQHRSSPHA